MTDEELERLIVEKLIEVIHDPNDPAEMHFAAWHSAHGLDGDCFMPGKVIEEALARLDQEHPESDDEDRLDFVYAKGLITANAVMVLDVAGRQFLVADDYVDGRNVVVVHELKPPLNFEAKHKEDNA